MCFTLLKSDPNSKARTGVLTTAHGEVSTPIFMPVGTQGSVKAVHQRELREDIGAQILLGNTYHLFLRPGTERLRRVRGLHEFMNWDRPLLTDSGGYQVYSLAERRRITEEGVRFQSHIDGAPLFFTPENAMDKQRDIGADIIMAFDECTPYPCTHRYAAESTARTHRWLARCVDHLKRSPAPYGYAQSLFPIVQGSVYGDLRVQSAEHIASYEAEGNAIGGLSVGEPHAEMYAMTEKVCEILPADKPRYLMGVGTPINLLEAIALGVDMFDCVMPTRNARNGMLFTWDGVLNIKNRKWADDFSALDPKGMSYVDRYYTKAYLRHLFKAGEYLAAQIASLHNLAFYLELMAQARAHISSGDFYPWKNRVVKALSYRL